MKYKLISRISNGFGNQMFVYAASFSISKKIPITPYIKYAYKGQFIFRPKMC